MNAIQFSLYLQNSLLKTADVCQHIWKALLIIRSSSGKAVACTHSKGFISDHTNACNHLCCTLIFIMDCITLLPYYSRMPFEAVVWLSCIKCGLEKASTLQKCNKLDCSSGTYHWVYHRVHAPQAGFSCSESHKGHTVTIIIEGLGIGIHQTNACPQTRYLVSIWNSFPLLVSFLLLIQQYFSKILFCFSHVLRTQKQFQLWPASITQFQFCHQYLHKLQTLWVTWLGWVF